MRRELAGFLVACLVVFATIATLDAALRLLYVARYYVLWGGPLQPEMIDHPYLTVAMRSRLAIGGLVTNSLGLRSPEFSAEKPARTYRIVVLGGSAGIDGSDNAHTFESLLEAMLNRRVGGGLRYEVINAAVPYYTSTQELFLAETAVIFWHPDMVIVYDGFNDAVNFSFSTYRPNWNFRNNNMMQALDEQEHPLRNEFFMAHLIYNWLHPQPRRAFVLHTEGVKTYEENIRSIVAILRERGIVPVLVLQPTLLQKIGLTPREQTLLTRKDAEVYYGVNYSMLRTLMPLEAQSIVRIARRANILYADFTHVFDNSKEETLNDLVHQTDLGNKIIAERLFVLIQLALPKQTAVLHRQKMGPIADCSFVLVQHFCNRQIMPADHSMHRRARSINRVRRQGSPSKTAGIKAL